MTEEALHHAAAKGGPHWIMTAALFVLISMLVIALPARTALEESRAIKRPISASCHAPECLSPRQIITSKEAFRMKRQFGEHALLVDIRDKAEIPAGLTFGADAQVPFMEPTVEMDFHVNFANDVDEALRSAHLRYEDPVILMPPSSDRGVLAALLLQEHGYSRIFVMRD
jgi:hypothetical protein